MAERRPTTARWASVLVLLGGLTGCGSASSVEGSDPPPAHHASSSASSAVRVTGRNGRMLAAATAIVDGGTSRVDGIAVVPGHPERRIVEWHVCRDPHCYHRTYALAVSADGFRTRHVVEVGPSRVANGWYLAPAGPDHFTIAPNGGRRRLVDLTGRLIPIRVTGGSGPLVGREVAVAMDKGAFLGVDPDTGRAHPLSVPAGAVEVEAAPSGQLRALTSDDPRYYWSADGGASWHEIPLPAADAHLGAEFVPTPSDALHVLVVGGENTVFPWDRVLESTDGRTWTSYDGPTDPTAYLDQSVVLPGGRLLMNVDGWSDQRGSRPSVNVPGLWIGADGAHVRPVPLAGPFAEQDVHRFVPTIIDAAVTRHSVTLYALTPDQKGVVSSTDGGTTWRPEAAR